MRKIDRRMELADMDEDVTDGQMADYLAAELSGDMGAWGIGVIEYVCDKCEINVQSISDVLKDVDALIARWHEKARTGDYFEKYVFEYLAFNAFLKNRVDLSASHDRRAIQTLKSQPGLKSRYLSMVHDDQENIIRDTWLNLICELERQPLRNSSRDFDNPDELDQRYWTATKCPSETEHKSGVVYSIDDWENMVEFWYAVRNNLFHAGKDPTLERDMFLVEHAFITLHAFMKGVMKQPDVGAR